MEHEATARSKSAELARTRSAGGTLGTLADRWEFRINDYDAIPCQLLWGYVSRAEKEKAIRAFMRAHAPQQQSQGETWAPLAGVEFYRTSGLRVR